MKKAFYRWEYMKYLFSTWRMGGKILSLNDSEWLGINFDIINPHRGDYIGTKDINKF